MGRDGNLERLLIAGNGMASVRLCEELVKRGPDRFEITVVGAEPEPGYNRVLLSSHLAGESSLEDIRLRPREWYEGNGIRLVTGTAVSSIEAAGRIATLETNERLRFDRLVFATGSEPIRLKNPGMELPGVLTFRDLSDVGRLKAGGRKAVVIGGGLLGLEAAYGLHRAGAEVTVVHLMDRLMERQLDDAAAGYLLRALEAKGIAFRLGAETECVVGENRVEAVRLKGGETIGADLVCAAIGILPRTSLARLAGCETGRGVKVDDGLETSIPGLYAIGECAEHRGVAYGLVEPAYRQAEILARRLCGDSASYEGSVLSTNLKVSGVAVFSAGDFAGRVGDEIVTYADRPGGEYRKLVIRDGALAGAILVGDANDALFYRDFILSGESIRPMREKLIFGEDFCREPLRKAA
jgi:nitrite reductase (NADH) large subunit